MGIRISIHVGVILIIIVFFFNNNSQTSAADYTAYVYKGCAQQEFPDPADLYTATVASLFNTLLFPQSLNTSFGSATAAQGPTDIYGIFQCLGDLKPAECHDCVTHLPLLSAKLCGKAVAARVHLAGCYSKYEIAGFQQVPDTEFLYPKCGSGRAAALGSEFERSREVLIGMVEKGVSENGGFYAGVYEDVYALGQCQGDLGAGDCAKCVDVALSNLKSGCGDAVNGQSYLLKCYVSYSYYANGVPSVVDTEANSTPDAGGRKRGAQRTTAIVVGGVAVLGFVIACLLFLKSVFKRKEKKQGGYYTYN